MVCTKCLLDFPESRFSVRSDCPGKPLRKQCRSCISKMAWDNIRKNPLRYASILAYSRKYSRKYKKKNREEVLRKMRERARRNRPAMNEYKRKFRKTEVYKSWYERYKQKNKIKFDARKVLRDSVYRGKIIRKPCMRCGSKTMVEGHHPDYSKPLDVLWLCRKHHQELHLSTRS